ncbi:MAG: ABC transporter permease [Limnochordia bacterium]
MNPLMRYSMKKLGWYIVTFFLAMAINFLLPRLIPGNPVSMIVSNLASGGVSSEALQKLYDTFMREFGLDKPILHQFLIFVGSTVRGDLGTSFSHYPRPVTDILASALTWTVALQLPAVLVGWIIGNVLGAIAAYRKGIFDRVISPVMLFLNSIPHYALGIILLYVFAVVLGWFPVGGGYNPSLFPSLTWEFIASVIKHYTLPFMSILLVTIGGQLIGMREMAIYELNADYVLYSRALGIKESIVARYVFKNAMLPQITGLATTLGLVVGGSLVAEVVFSYPGIGTYLFAAIRQSDYPVIQGCTLIITFSVLLANLIMDLTYGFIDPRIKAAQTEEVGA